MEFYFFDSSAIVKNYVLESGTNWVKSVFNAARNIIYVVSVTEVEVVSAFARREKGQTLNSSDAKLASQQFRYDFANDFRIIELRAGLLNSAAFLAQNYILRGYDAIQLSAAIEVAKQIARLKLSPLIFVSADEELNSAAQAEGLAIENPNNYP